MSKTGMRAIVDKITGWDLTEPVKQSFRENVSKYSGHIKIPYPEQYEQVTKFLCPVCKNTEGFQSAYKLMICTNCGNIVDGRWNQKYAEQSRRKRK